MFCSRLAERGVKNTAGGSMGGGAGPNMFCPRTPKLTEKRVKYTAGMFGGVGLQWGADRFIYARRFLLEFHPPLKSGPESPGHREGEVVVKPNTAGGSVGWAWCCHRKVVQNPPSVQADAHNYFLRRPKAGGSTRHRKVVQT